MESSTFEGRWGFCLGPVKVGSSQAGVFVKAGLGGVTAGAVSLLQILDATRFHVVGHQGRGEGEESDD